MARESADRCSLFRSRARLTLPTRNLPACFVGFVAFEHFPFDDIRCQRMRICSASTFTSETIGESRGG